MAIIELKIQFPLKTHCEYRKEIFAVSKETSFSQVKRETHTRKEVQHQSKRS